MQTAAKPRETGPVTLLARPGKLAQFMTRVWQFVRGLNRDLRRWLEARRDAPISRAGARDLISRYFLPAEAALRRAIHILAATTNLPDIRHLEIRSGEAAKSRKRPARPGARPASGSIPAFCLTEPMPRPKMAPRPKTARRPQPAPRPKPAPDPAYPGGVARLLRRLAALEHAMHCPDIYILRWFMRRLNAMFRGASDPSPFAHTATAPVHPGLAPEHATLLEALNHRAIAVLYPPDDTS